MSNSLVDVDDDCLSDAELLVKYAPEHIGPVWERGADGRFVLPERTLGWQCAGWCAEYLASVAAGAAPGEPFMFTLEQLRFLLWWYAVDGRGRFVYRRGILQRVKGWGKDPLCAVLGLLELCGPTRFTGWDDEGNPVGGEQFSPWVQVAAVSLDQTVNTMALFQLLITDKLRTEYRLDVKKMVIYSRGGRGRLQAVTSSPNTLQGNRATFVVCNETQHWYASNGGKALWTMLDGNLSKMGGRAVAITNAPNPGEDSVAYDSYLDYLKGVEAGTENSRNVLYDSLFAPSYTPLTKRAFTAAFTQVRGDSVWLDVESMWGSVSDPSRPISDSRRMYLNQIWATDDALYQPGEWDRLRVDDGLVDGDRVVLGFDGGKTDDATVLVGMRVSDCLIVPLHCQERPDGPAGQGWQVDRDRVEAAVSEAFDRFDVAGFFADVALWESHILQWGRVYGSGLEARASDRDPISFDMRSAKRSVAAHEEFMSAVLAGRVKHNGDSGLRRHVLNCYRNDTRWGVSFRKESRESKRKVDLYAGAMLAYTAWRVLVSKDSRAFGQAGRRSGRVWMG